MKLVLASANPGKQREFQALLEPLGISLILQSALAIDSVEEIGDTFEANALLKARHATSCAQLPALADDSGLEVDALGGRPGVHSARYAGESGTDLQNNARLLQELVNVLPERRTARYRCVLVLVRYPRDPAPIVATGVWEGRIGQSAVGEGGFGYDPLFIPDGFACSAAQLSLELKNRLSHRALALAALARALQSCEAGAMKGPP